MALVATSLAGAPAASAATTRAEYASQVNAVCDATQREGERLFDKLFNVKIVVNPDKEREPKVNRKKALRGFQKIFTAFHRLNARMIDGLAAVTPAPGDEALVASWIGSLRTTHELNVPVIRRTMDALRFLFKAAPTSGDDEDLSRGERKKFKRHTRRVNRASKAATAEGMRANGFALQLGATECTPEGSASSAAARSALGSG